MNKSKKKTWIPKEDFRTRFAQRDLEISINEYNRIRLEYLESQRKKKEEAEKLREVLAEQERLENEARAKKQKEAEDTLKRTEPARLNSSTKLKQESNAKNTELKIPSVQQLLENSRQQNINFLNRKIGSKFANAPQEKKEHYLDINIPSIISLVDDYTKPVVYNSTSGLFEIINDSEENIGFIRESLSNRPAPYEMSDYESRYFQATDPLQRLKDVLNRYNVLPDPVDVRERQEATGAVWEGILGGLLSSPQLPGLGAAPYESMTGTNTSLKYNIGNQRDKGYIDDVISTFSIGKNNSEFDAYIETAIGLGEKKLFADAILQYSDNIQQFINWQKEYDQIKEDPTVSAEYKTKLLVLMNNLLSKNEKLRPSVENAVSYKYGTSVGRNAFSSIRDFFINILDDGYPGIKIKPLIGVKSFSELLPEDVGSYGKRLLDLTKGYKLTPGLNVESIFLDLFLNLRNSITSSNKLFLKDADQEILKDKELALLNKQEAIDWLEWHTPSAEFKAKEKAAQENYLTSFDTYTHGMWGVLGSSASFNGVLLLSTGLNWLGAGLLAAPHPYAKAAGGVSTAVGAGLGIVSGVYENKAEVTLNYISGLRNSLQERGLLTKFLEDGRKQLAEKGILVRDDDDVFRHFILKDYKVNNPIIQELALRHMFGANNLFQNDMMAVSADVAFNAGLNVFGATGKIAEAMKLLPVGSKYTILRKVATSDLASSTYHATAKLLKPNVVASALSPLANIPYNVAVKPLVSAVEKTAIKPMLKEAATYMTRALEWAKVAPKGIFKNATAGKYLLDFLGKLTARGFSEAIEEGKQYLYGKEFSEGKFAGKSNSILSTLIDDLSTGLFTGTAFIAGQFLGIEPDRELMSNMRGGFLGGILNSGAAITAGLNISNLVGEIKAGDMIFNNIMAEKLRQRSALINGEEMAKYASRSGYAAMMKAMDRVEQIHRNITESSSERVGLSKESIDEQRTQFKRIAAIANSVEAKARAKALGIKENTDKYRAMVSLINLADMILMENIDTFNDLVDQANNILENDGMSLDVVKLFNEAWAAADTKEKRDLVERAAEFVEWILPLNNLVVGQYNALNRLIQELEDRSEFLTKAEQRNLNHYKALRKKLDETVEDIKQKIGGTENMEFMNAVPQDILDKYTSIYRTLYQASALLETSTVVLDNLWGRNTAKTHANDYVSEQLDFIENRIDKLNSQKHAAVNNAQKNNKNLAAVDLINKYQNSVEDDVELMAEIANRFDKENADRENLLNGTTIDKNLEENSVEPATSSEEQLSSAQDTSGVQGLPNDTTQLALPAATQYPVGTTIENINNPGYTFTIQDVKINPSTGQFLIEALDNNNKPVVIEENEIQQYQKALPAPYHYETVFKQQKADSWTRFKTQSPFAKAFDSAKNNLMPAVVGDSFREYAEQLFKTRMPRSWDEDSSQYDRLEHLMTVDSVLRNKMVEWNPIYGCIYTNDKGQYFYAPSYAKFTPEMYKDFKSRRNNKLKTIKQLIDLRDANDTAAIKKLLNDHNINEAYLNVLNDEQALMSIAEQIAEFGKPSVQEWMNRRAAYMDLQYLLDSVEGQRIFSEGNVIVTNVQTSLDPASAFIDIVSIDKEGRSKIYILSFVNDVLNQDTFDKLGNHQDVSKKDYYTSLANDIFATLEPHMQLSVEGVYLLPIDPIGSGMPIKLAITTPINNNTSLQNRAAQRTSSIANEIEEFKSIATERTREKPEQDNDGTAESTLADIASSIDQMEDVITDVYNGKYSFNWKIRSDVRQYLDTDKNVLTKQRSYLRSLDLTDEVKNYISRIETLYQQIINILSAYKSTDVYNQGQMIYSGETINSHRPIIPEGHSLSARSSSGIPVTATSDFITNGKVELMYGWYNPQTKEFVVMNGYSTHPGVGVYAVFTYNGIKHDPVLVLPAHYKEGMQAYTEEGALFITDVITMQNSSLGMPVVATARRLIPNPRYNGPLKPILSISALKMTLDDLLEITGDSDSVGITNVNNDVQLINRGEDKSSLWHFKSTQAGNIFLLHSFNFKEYNDGAQIPVKLIPAKLDKTDIDVIVSILKTNAVSINSGFGGTMSSKYKISNNETPLKNEDVLRMLTPYSPHPDDRSLFYVDSYGNVFFKQHVSDPEPMPIDILTSTGEQRFRSLLSNGYEIAQNRDILNAKLGNQTDPIFAGLRFWIKENGSLVISKNLVFDDDDVARNNVGFSGIGWSLKHGRLLSNMSGIYEPSISISNPTIDNSGETGTVGSAFEDEPVQRELVKPREIDNSDLLTNQWEFGADWYAAEEIPEETLSEEEATEDIVRMLGESAVEFVDDIICILQNGLKALGATLDNVIILSKLAPIGTQFHEAFHKILELLLDENTRNRIYTAFTNLHPEVDVHDTRRVTEGLAEDFRAYANKEKASSKWARFWNHIWKFITTMFNADKRVLYKLYRNAYRGKYRNIKPTKENIERFNRIFAISDAERGALYHTIYDATSGENVNLPSVPSDADYRSAIDTIVNYIVSESGAGLFGQSVTKIKLSKEDVQKLGKKGSIYKQLIGKENPDDINKIFRDIFENWEHVLGDVTTSLKRFGLHFKHNRNSNEIETYKTNLSEIEQEAKEEADEGKAKSADINQYELADYEVSKLQKMTEKTKYFFATIPDVRFVEDFDEEPMYVPERNEYGEEIDAKGRIIKLDKETGTRYIETKDGEVIWVPSKDGNVISTAQVPINMVRNTKLQYNNFGYPQFAPFYNTCKVALNRCYSANSLEELLQLFRDASVEFPVFTVIAQRYASLLNNMKLRDKNGYYITTDGKRYRRLNNGLFQEVSLKKSKTKGKEYDAEEYYTPDELKAMEEADTKLASEKDEVYYTADELDFKINRNNLSLAISVFNNISGTRLHFFNIMSTRPAPSSIIFLRMDTEGGYSARKYTKAWHALFINDMNKVRPVEVTRNGEALVIYKATNVNLFKDVARELKLIVDSYSDRHSQGWRTGEILLGNKIVHVYRDPETVKAYYLKLLNKIGILVTIKEFNHLLFELYGKTDINALRKYFQQDGEDFGRSKGVSLKKLILAIEQGVSENGELSRTVTSGTLYSNIGAVTQLADGIWSYRQTTRDLQTRAPGKNRYYQVANRNAQDVFMQDLNDPESKMLKDLYSNPYHRGSIYIESLLNGSIYLRSNTSAGYVSDNKSDFGADFMSITDAEDAISKITLLVEGDITPPTLSNKKTYQPILIFDAKTNVQILLPGIYYIHNKNNAQTGDATAEVYKASNVPVLVDKPWIKKAPGDYSMNGKEFVVSDEIYNALIKYAFSEYYQIKENEQRLATIPDSEKVVNYDTAEKGAKIPGALRFSRFYEIYVRKEVDGKSTFETISFNDNNVKSYKDNLSKAEAFFFGDKVTYEDRKAILTEIINRRLEENLEYLVSLGIIKHRSKNWKSQPFYTRYAPVVIDTARLNAIQKSFGQKMSDLYGVATMRSVAICAFVLDVQLKHLIGLEEYQRLFVGNPNLFVTTFNEDGSVLNDTGDLSKRLGGHMSTGETQCRVDDVPDQYTVGELKDFRTTSSLIKELRQWFDESESRSVLYSTEQKKIFIEMQDLRHSVEALAQSIYKKNYNADGIMSSNQALFDKIQNDDIKDEIALQLETASHCENLFAYSEAVKALKSIVQKYKKMLITAEYKRQKDLSLDKVKEELENHNLLTGVNARVAAYIQNFEGKINVADGASFVSPLMVKYMLIKIGKFSGKVERAWEALQNGNVTDPLKSALMYALINDAMFGTQKYTATGYRMNNGQPITYYTKSAFFPLFRQIAHGKTKDILDKMEEDGVMMVPFESAKKFGSQGKQDFPTTPEGLAEFHFNVYKEDFKYLRKQLNTDPKEEDLQTVGTQTKKIALTILDAYKNDYVKRDGTTETGEELRDRIFNDERVLAMLGFMDLINRFNSVEEKAKYLRDNLGERDADQNMLQGLSLIDDIDTGKKRMRAHLEALSNSGWIQSIITALANKHIIDVNLPGAAYVQRSVYAMEDNSILGDNEVYGIPKLHISNDWNSMDAVVSIDYFYRFFPQLEEMSFENARQWLIDHNVIGENAKAETVAYRIPTQANSSIHALRFIDVIGTVRDTIILPEEFTAITGSDFDIDKLFLSTKYYEYNEANDEVTTEFDKISEPKKHYGNDLLECYIELLTQDKNKYANQLVRSIDYDTNIPGQVVELLKKGKTTKVSVYQALLLYQQCHIKSENRTGGIGVGPYALNNNNEIMTMQFEVESDNIGLIKALDVSRLYDRLDAEGNSVMSTIGAFITGHVDIAKDPWVGVLNINEYTYDIHIFLARAGLGLRALWFCSLPIIRKAAEAYIRAGGYLYDSRDESIWVRRNRAFKQLEDTYLLDDSGVGDKDSEATKLLKAVKGYRNNYSSLNGSLKRDNLRKSVENAIYAIQQIFGVDPNNPSIKINTFLDKDGNQVDGTILQDIALYHNQEEDISDPTPRYTIKTRVENADGSVSEKKEPISVKDVQFYVYLANVLLDDSVQDMKTLVLYSKVETKKQGKNRAELLAYNHRYNLFFKEGRTRIMLPETVLQMASESSIDTKQNLFTTAVEQILGTELLPYTAAYEYFIRDFISKASIPYKKDCVKGILEGIGSYQKWEYVELYATRNGISIRDLFVGSNSIYNELMRLKSLVIEYPAIYRNYSDGNGSITNALLESLQPADIPGYIMQDYGTTLPKFVDFGAINDNESSNNNDIIAGWDLMLTDIEHPDFQQFARRLIVYAFITSGDTNKPGAFFNLVPFRWREHESLNNLNQTYVLYIDLLIQESQPECADDTGAFRISGRALNEDIYELILRNNWFNNDLVPTIQETSKDDMGNTVNNYFQYTLNGEPILISLVKTTIDGNGVRRFHESTLESPKLIIKLHNYDAHSYTNPQDFKLYRFVRMGTVFNSDGEAVSFPIYGRISQIGGIMYGHSIITYRDDLDMSWERDTKWYTKELDARMIEGLAQIRDHFDKQLQRNIDQVTKGIVTYEELKLDTFKAMPEMPIMGSYEDGTPVGYTRSNATLFYEMVKSMAAYDSLFGKKTSKYSHNNSLKSIKKPAPVKEPVAYTMHSGGAPGADTYWGEIATQFGIDKQKHYYHGEQSTSNAPNANTRISEADYNEGKKEAAAAAKYNWGYQYDTMKDDRLVRNWSQVKYSDAIFAIGTIANVGDKAFPNQANDTRTAIHPMVTGGTGYAVGMAILHNKPVYVFDQEQEQWFAWNGEQFNPIDTPTLTLNFAGIGTREINEAGKQAIKDVFAKTFEKVVEEKPAELKKIDIWSTNHDKYANLSNVAIRPIEVTSSIIQAVNNHFAFAVAKKLDVEGGLINRILRLAPEGFEKFNSVEQLFLLIKFEAMKEFVREQAKLIYSLSGVDIAKGSTDIAAAIKSLVDGIKDKQRRIFIATGSKITQISHERLPNIEGMIDAFFAEKWNEGGPSNVLNSTAYDIIREIMLQSFLQNVGAAKNLLSTEDAELTHEKGGVYWSVGFPEAIMSIRQEISENYEKLKDIENRALTLLGGDKIAYEEYTLSMKTAKEGKRFSDVSPFFTPEEAAQIQQAIPSMEHIGGNGKLIITSASRHTDPVFYATEIIDTLRENFKKPLTDPSRINIIELWSKHDGVPMQNILEACKKYRVAPMVSFSITTLGDSTFEPGVMKDDDLLDNIEKLIRIGLIDPRVTTFRIDPILVGVTSINRLKHVIERGVKMGIRKFVTSPVQSYNSNPKRNVVPYVDKAIAADPDAVVKYPGVITLTGEYDWMKYYGKDKYNPQYIAFVPKQEYLKPYIDMFLEMMSKYDITIQSCAVSMKGLTPSACLDPEIVEAITSLKVEAVEDPTRKLCKCYGVHSDMFRYDDECKSSCVYCYAGQMKTLPFSYYDDNGKLKDFSYSKINEYEEVEEGPVKVVIRNDEYTLNDRDVVDANGQPVDADTRNRVIWKRAVDINKADLVKVDGIYYVVTNTGIIFNWGTAKVENFDKYSTLKKTILRAAQAQYEKPVVSTVFNAAELKQLGESRKKFCKI